MLINQVIKYMQAGTKFEDFFFFFASFVSEVINKVSANVRGFCPPLLKREGGFVLPSQNVNGVLSTPIKTSGSLSTLSFMLKIIEAGLSGVFFFSRIRTSNTKSSHVTCMKLQRKLDTVGLCRPDVATDQDLHCHSFCHISL